MQLLIMLATCFLSLRFIGHWAMAYMYIATNLHITMNAIYQRWTRFAPATTLQNQVISKK